MKLAVSNIAWTNEEEPQVASLLKELGVKYVEVAPTKLWQDPTAAAVEELEAYREKWSSWGLEIVAFQSMLFNRPDLKLFESKENTAQTLDYLTKYIGVAKTMGAKVMVFGSPKNRQRGELPESVADSMATAFFTAVGDAARQNGVAFCIEPNATDYACDFITSAAEGQAFVSELNHPGIRLHLDIACMTLAKDDVAVSITAAKDYLEHFHISSPFLDAVTDLPEVKHRDAAAALRDIGYANFVSIEMRPGDLGTNLDRVRTAVTFAQEVYGV